MQLTVLNIACPFAPVGPKPIGGAEQVLAQLDRALVLAGHDSVVMACEGSTAEGILISMPRSQGVIDESVRRLVHDQYRFAIAQLLSRWRFDVIHMHGIDFHEYLPPPEQPTLVTLHLPPQSYPEHIFHLDRPRTFLHFVSESQGRENRVSEEKFARVHARRDFTFASGALADIMDHSRTKLPVENPGEMTEAIGADPEVDCQAAQDRFSMERTIESCFAIYDRLAAEYPSREPSPHAWQGTSFAV